jgi:hypothetical protein
MTIYQRISNDLKESQISLGVILWMIPITFCTYLFHESGHWTLGELMGNDMTISLNNSAPVSGHFNSETAVLLSAIGGPLFTILQALIFSIVSQRTGSIYAFSVVFMAVYSRYFSILFGDFKLQDESGISSLLQVNQYLIALIVLFILFLILWKSSRRMGLNLKAIGYFITFGTLNMLIVIGTNAIIT